MGRGKRRLDLLRERVGVSLSDVRGRVAPVGLAAALASEAARAGAPFQPHENVRLYTKETPGFQIGRVEVREDGWAQVYGRGGTGAGFARVDDSGRARVLPSNLYDENGPLPYVELEGADHALVFDLEGELLGRLEKKSGHMAIVYDAAGAQVGRAYVHRAETLNLLLAGVCAYGILFRDPAHP